MAEHLRRTRGVLTEARMPHAGRYDSVEELLGELSELSDALIATGLARVAWGELADLRWQVETFGFYLASLEIRQHAAVHESALAIIHAGGDLLAELDTAPGVSAAEVLATFRVVADVQRRFGAEACHRYVISFTRQPSDVLSALADPRSTSCRSSNRRMR
jgi:phosphoenolpyruvate carboxylase